MANVNAANNIGGLNANSNTTNANPANNLGAGNNNPGQEDISPEGLLQVISQEW